MNGITEAYAHAVMVRVETIISTESFYTHHVTFV